MPFGFLSEQAFSFAGIPTFRSWRAKYGENWEEKFRETYEAEMISKNDTHFYVGTVAAHPNRWIIIGLFYPPHEPQTGLF